MKMVYESKWKGTAYEFDGLNRDEAIDVINSWFENAPPNAILNVNSYDDASNFEIQWQRPETPKEIEARLNSEANQKEWRRKQWEQLNKEFGPKE